MTEKYNASDILLKLIFFSIKYSLTAICKIQLPLAWKIHQVINLKYFYISYFLGYCCNFNCSSTVIEIPLMIKTPCVYNLYERVVRKHIKITSHNDICKP